MRVLLVNPNDEINVNTRLPKSLNKVQGIYPPLGLSYIAAVLEDAGHDVMILDLPALNLTIDEVRAEVVKYKPDVVGISCMTSTLMGSLPVARLCKEEGATVVLGGPQLCAFPQETMSYEFVDFGIVGEAEYSFRDLVDALSSGSDYTKIPGLLYKRGGKIIQNGFCIVEDLDSLPLPARHLLPMDRYYCSITDREFTTMISSRGCPYRCGFCFKQPTDLYPRFRSPRLVVDEIEECISRYGTKWFMFYDDTIGSRREHIASICGEIIRRGLRIKWESPMRVNEVDGELLRLMRKSGCVRLRFGVESGDPDILRLMRKGISLDRVREVFAMTREAGIETFAYFIVGYVRETPQTMRRTIDFAKELNPDWVMFTVATPYPQTNLFDLAADDGLIDRNYWRDFTLGRRVDRIPYLTKNSEEYVEKAYREFYMRPEYVLRKLRQVNSLDTLRRYVAGALGIVSFRIN